MGERSTIPSKKKWNKKNKPIDNGNKTMTKFMDGNERMKGNYFDCTGYDQSDRFVKTVDRMAVMVGQDYRQGGTTRTEVETQEAIKIKEPTKPKTITRKNSDGDEITVVSDPIESHMYVSRLKFFDMLKQTQKENHEKVFSLAWEQCTEQLRSALRSHKDFQTIKTNLDGIALLRVIKLICFHIEDEKFIPVKAHEALKAYYSLSQGNESAQIYHTRFLNTVKVIDQCGASLGEDPMTRAMVCEKLQLLTDSTNSAELLEITKAARDYKLAMGLLLNSDPKRYNAMLIRLKNNFMAGQNLYPTNLTEAYGFLTKWEAEDNSKAPHNPRHYEETTFATDGDEIRQVEPWHSGMTCHKCQKKGHLAYFCPKKKKNADTNVQTSTVDENEESTQNLIHGVDDYNADDDDDFDYEAHLFLQLEIHDMLHLKDGINGGRIPKSWILLDSQSTTDVYSNPNLLTNIRKVKGSLTIHTQAGKAMTTMKGTVPGYGDVWYHAKGIANILSLANVAKTRKVIFNSSNGNQFEVMKDDGTSRIFRKSEHGLYYFDMKKKEQVSH
jgi:hypothetical protein